MKIKLIIYLIVLIVLLFLILDRNPYLFTTKLLKDQDNFQVHQTLILKKSKNTIVDSPIYYRNNIARNPVFYIPVEKLKISKKFRTKDINVGIHSASKASAISDGELIFVGSDTSWFYCFDFKGNLVWRFYAGNSPQGIHSTAALDGQYVYFGSYRGTLYKLDKKTGALVWLKTLGETIGSSPLIEGRNIIVAIETFPADGYVVKVDKYSGELIWKSDNLGEQSHSSPGLSRDKKNAVSWR